MKKGPDTHHVVPSPQGGWDVKRGGADRASSHHDTKRDAVTHAREISRNQRTELRIHNKDGRIAESDSHGTTPTRLAGRGRAADGACADKLRTANLVMVHLARRGGSMTVALFLRHAANVRVAP